MRQATHVRVVREWCQSLGVLAAVSISRQEAELKLAAFVPLLMDRFPDLAFTNASLEYVAARARKGFPTYGELADWLGEWWRENRPPVRNALAAPDQRTPTEEREQLAAQIAASWDDPSGIMMSVRDHAADPVALRLLAAAVAKWAPQHAHLVPQPEPEQPAEDVAQPASVPGARYLPDALLDEKNPLPNGYKRAPFGPVIDRIADGEPT